MANAVELIERVDRLRKEQPAVALEALNAGFRNASRAAESTQRGLLWRTRAHLLRALRRSREAIAAYARADDWFRKAGDRFERGRTAIGHIDALMYQGRYHEARRVARRGRRWLEGGRDRAALARLLNNEGNLLHRIDRPDLALPLYRRARSVLARAGAARAAAMVDGNVANCLTLAGRTREARRLYRAAVQTHERAGAHVDALNARYNLAYLDFVDHRHERALELLSTIGEEAAARSAPALAALARLDRAEILLHLGSAYDVLGEAKAAEDGCQALGLSYERAKAETFAALAEHRLGRHAAARERLQRAAAVFQSEGNAVWAGEALLGLATVWRAEGHTRGAAVLLAAAVRRFAAARDREREACARALRARINARAGKYASARRDLRRVSPLARQRTSWRLRHLLWSARAELARCEGDGPGARRWLRRAAEASERLAARILDEQWRASFWGEWGWPHGDLAQLELDHGRTREAFEVLERGRGRGLLGRRRRAHSEPPLPQAVRTWASSRLVRDRERTRSHVGILVPRPLEPALREALDEHVVENVSLPLVQRSVAADTLLVDYMLHGGVLHAFAITRNDIAVVRDLATQDVLDRMQHAITFALRDGVWGGAPGQAQLDDLLTEMASLVLWPVLRAIDGSSVRRVAFVPVAPLSRLPWAALPTAGGARLCETCPPSLVPGLRLGLRRAPRSQAAGPPLVLASPGDHLERTEEEVAAIRAGFPKVVCLVGRHATRRAFARHAPRASWIHFAGHGAFHADHPERSGLLFADGWLEARALAELKLSARWVTLSACQSARALVRPGEEWFGLARALMLAGAQSVVAAQWDIGDGATARLMESTYRAFGAGTPLDLALAHAQQRAHHAARHPFEWAGFVTLNGPAPQIGRNWRFVRARHAAGSPILASHEQA